MLYLRNLWYVEYGFKKGSQYFNFYDMYTTQVCHGGRASIAQQKLPRSNEDLVNRKLKCSH